MNSWNETPRTQTHRTCKGAVFFCLIDPWDFAVPRPVGKAVKFSSSLLPTDKPGFTTGCKVSEEIINPVRGQNYLLLERKKRNLGPGLVSDRYLGKIQ